MVRRTGSSLEAREPRSRTLHTRRASIFPAPPPPTAFPHLHHITHHTHTRSLGSRTVRGQKNPCGWPPHAQRSSTCASARKSGKEWERLRESGRDYERVGEPVREWEMLRESGKHTERAGNTLKSGNDFQRAGKTPKDSETATATSYAPYATKHPRTPTYVTRLT